MNKDENAPVGRLAAYSSRLELLLDTFLVMTIGQRCKHSTLTTAAKEQTEEQKKTTSSSIVSWRQIQRCQFHLPSN